ncbi:MAG: hypothetical protein GY719_41960 [bacterium]|nr:hypothetical protein [bacterium]
MTDDQALTEAIQSIHSTLEQAEHQLASLGESLQFLIGPEGEVEIVRRGRTGGTLRPKVVIAELKGCDPMFWRPDHPSWMHALDPERDASRQGGEVTGPPPDPAAEGDVSEEGGGTEPPAGAAEEN